ncbi:MAG: hypothetical protein GX575_05645 [Candidatus Anammoximicrobium sp.]|nr:hypothetical protein [Candidatus Anammoximicrobium sp.]
MSESLVGVWSDLRDFVLARGAPGTEITRSHSWPWGPSVAIVLVVLAAAFVIGIYAREQGRAGRLQKAVLAAHRILLIVLVVFLLYGWMLHRHRTDLPDLVLLIDDSGSMATVDEYHQDAERVGLARRVQAAGLTELSRLDLAKMLLLERNGELLRQLEQRYRLKVYRVGGSARALTGGAGGAERGSAAWLQDLLGLQASEPSSRLGKSLQDVLAMQRGRPTAAVILFSDGVTTEGKTVAEVAGDARRRAVPLFLVGLGNSRPPRDVRLADLLVDDVVFVGDLVHFDFKLSATGYAGQRATVRLAVRGREGQPAVEQQITLGQDGLPQSVRLSYRPEEKGDFEFAVEVEPLAGEGNLENNRQTRVVKVRDDALRVLYVQAYPSYDFRYLKTVLSRSLKPNSNDKAVELTTVLQDADPEHAAQDETAARVFPVSREELFAYDVLIFGDVNPSFLSRSVMEHIVAFVQQRGGGLVVLAGPAYTPLAYRDTPLAALLPVNPDTASVPAPGAALDQGFAPQPTRLGITSPPLQLADSVPASLAVWREMPEWYWSLTAPDLRPGARVLAADPSRLGAGGEHLPLISMQFVGAGKVVFHATDETYRWARHPGGERYYARYWLQMLRYLSRAKLLEGGRLAELTADRTEYRRGETVRLRARFFDDRLAPSSDDGVTVLLESEGNQRRQLTLHRDAASRGVFEGLAGNLPDGKYRAWIATPALAGQPPSQRFAVVAPPGEQARLEMDAADLQAAAKTSQGRFYTVLQAHRLLDDLPRGRQVRIESLPPVPIWNSSLWAGLFVALIASEWLLRKRAGML